MLKFLAKNKVSLAVWLVMATLITVLAAVFGQSLWRILPLYVSLATMILQSEVNRLAPLVGGLNSLLYATVYLSYGLYGSAANAIFVSFPFQLVTFVNWSRRPSGKTVLLRKLGTRARIWAAVGFAVCWASSYAILTALGSKNILFDNTSSLVGLLSSILMMLAYIEYSPLMVFGCVSSVGLYLSMIRENPEQITYLVYAIYSLICTVIGFKNAVRNYRAQNGEKGKLCQEN